MNYRKYQMARDAAWRILLDCGIDRLPVDLNMICEKLGIQQISYATAERLISEYNLSRIISQSDGLTFYSSN